MPTPHIAEATLSSMEWQNQVESACDNDCFLDSTTEVCFLLSFYNSKFSKTAAGG
jgi:hypothetical protein